MTSCRGSYWIRISDPPANKRDALNQPHQTRKKETIKKGHLAMTSLWELLDSNQ